MNFAVSSSSMYFLYFVKNRSATDSLVFENSSLKALEVYFVIFL